MSFLVLHMDKFKKEAVRGIQNHNQRERQSHSNPDINYDKSHLNYDLHNNHKINFSKTIEQRLDELDLKKAIRHDAVYMCGLVVSSDSAFFEKKSDKTTREFFEACQEFLTKFVGKENVIAASVHLDEKTPHMHFTHVPVSNDGRLNANKIYTRASLKKLQSDLPKYLQNRGFIIERGVEQEKGSAKKHLTTRDFKQQQEALANLKLEIEKARQNLAAIQKEEKNLTTELAVVENLAHEARRELESKIVLPKPGLIVSKSTYTEALKIIGLQKKALADQGIIEHQNKQLWQEQSKIDSVIQSIREKYDREVEKHRRESEKNRRDLQETRQALKKIEEVVIHFEKFLQQPEAKKMFERFERREQTERENSLYWGR